MKRNYTEEKVDFGPVLKIFMLLVTAVRLVLLLDNTPKITNFENKMDFEMENKPKYDADALLTKRTLDYIKWRFPEHNKHIKK